VIRFRSKEGLHGKKLRPSPTAFSARHLLHGFDGQSGKVVFDGGKTRLSGLRHFGTLIAAEGHLYVGADNAIYAFTFAGR